MYGLLKTQDPNITGKKVIAKTVLAVMDKNEDGEITESEFVQSASDQYNAGTQGYSYCCRCEIGHQNYRDD